MANFGGMTMGQLEHIGIVIKRVLEQLARGWEQEREKGKAQHEEKRRVLQFNPDSQRYFEDEI